MQIAKSSNVQNQSAYVTKQEKKAGTFKDTLTEKEKEIEYENLKVMGNGELYGYVNGNWENTHANFKHRKCGPNEILVIDENFIEIGVNLIKNGYTFGGMRGTPFAIQEDMGFSAMENGLALIPGKMVRLPDGTILKWTKNGVECISGRGGNFNKNMIANKRAMEMALVMEQFTRVANRQALGVGRGIGIAKDKTRDIRAVLSAMGIDTSREFYVNGKKFMFDKESGELKYTFESSVYGEYTVKYAKGPRLRLARN